MRYWPLPAVVFLMGALLISAPALASGVLVSWDCSPYKDLKNPGEAALRPYKGQSDAAEFADGKAIFKRRHDSGASIVWELSQKGNAYELSGFFIPADGKSKNLLAPVTIPNNKLPVVVQTKMLGAKTGYRDCQVSLVGAPGTVSTLSQVISPSNNTSAATRSSAVEKQITRDSEKTQANRDQIAKNTQNVLENRKSIDQNKLAIAQTQGQVLSRTTKVNEAYGQGRTGSAESWAIYKSGVPFQQQQFCRIMENFRDELSAAETQKNQIKENIAYRTREQRLASLMPDGNFSNWIVRAVSVKQASDGSAAVLFELPCNVVIGSHACGQNAKSFVGTISENSRLYSELVNIAVGDFLGVSGTFNFVDEKAAFQKGRSVATFRAMKTGSHCEAKDLSTTATDFFASAVSTLSTLK